MWGNQISSGEGRQWSHGCHRPRRPGFVTNRSQAVVAIRQHLGGSPRHPRFWRVQAFASTSAFRNHPELISVGDPASGFLEATSGARVTAQLTGWGPVGSDEWRFRQPQSFRDTGFELNGDAVAVLPKLSMMRFLHHRLPTPRTIASRPPASRVHEPIRA